MLLKSSRLIAVCFPLGLGVYKWPSISEQEMSSSSDISVSSMKF